jgi:hypothetical protein
MSAFPRLRPSFVLQKNFVMCQSCPLPSSIDCADNFLELVHGDRFEQDVVTKTWRNRHVRRDIAISKCVGVGQRQC